ncbi:hypothetical protein [Arthrobacter sp. JSM 101049]|uniref:hypothetical protein n=1 Tax=Arthrobacter sp. JSM 101049 TaxID=929097 RepID=UPI003569E6A1
MSISYHLRPVPDNFLRPLRSDEVQPCTCAHCGTDEYLVPDNIQPSILPGGTGGWDVTYWCSQCDGFFGHLAASLPATWRAGST